MGPTTRVLTDRNAPPVLFQEEIRSGAVSCYTIPTDAPEADGTFRWNKTTLVVAELRAADSTGFGYSYADTSTGLLARTLIAEVVQGQKYVRHPIALVCAGRGRSQPGPRRHRRHGHFRH